MTFKQVLDETTLFTHGGAPKTKHDSKRSKFASKDIHKKDYEDALKGKKAYNVWKRKIRIKI